MSRGPMPGVVNGQGYKSPAVEAPEPPEWLCEEGRAEWYRVTPDLLSAGMIARADRAALSAYCQAWAELVDATKALQRDGRYLSESQQNSKGEVLGEKLKPHPAIASQRDAFGRVKSFLAEFGLTPSARARLKVVRDGGPDALAAILDF
jgi:P27 family predicted phage terminase small subunit